MTFKRILLEYFAGILIHACVSSGHEPPKEQKLHHYLLQKKHYNKLIRPSGSAGNGTGELTVNLGMRLSQILELVSEDFVIIIILTLEFVFYVETDVSPPPPLLE